MTENDARDEVRYLRGLYPTLTPEQGRYWLAEFQRFGQREVREAIHTHYRTHKEFVNGPGLTDGIRAVLARKADRKQDGRDREQELAAYWQRVDQAIAAVTDDEALERLKIDALDGDDSMNVLTKMYLLARNPRKSRALKGLIFRNLELAELAGRLA